MRFERVDERYRDNRSGQTVENRDQQWLPGLTWAIRRPRLVPVCQRAKSLRAPQVTQIVKGDQRGAELAWNYESGVRYTPGRRSACRPTTTASTTRTVKSSTTTPAPASSTWARPLSGRRNGGLLLPAFLEGMTLHAGYAYLDSEQLIGANAGRQMPYASRHQLVLDGRYQWRDTTFALSGYYYSAAFSDKENTRDETAKGMPGACLPTPYGTHR
ncbi:TonB-dependent receptor [Edwardsiella anguillarum]|nr:TonB-dependent receptor [Edwardsiella anguillarum]